MYRSAAERLKDTEAVNVQMVLKARTNTNSNKVHKFPEPKDVAIIIPNRADNDRKNPRDVVLTKSKEINTGDVVLPKRQAQKEIEQSGLVACTRPMILLPIPFCTPKEIMDLASMTRIQKMV